MSADEFDPFVERLFARTPTLPDAPLFVARVEARLAGGARVRSLVLTVAGLLGGVVAVRETINLKINVGAAQASPVADEVGQGLQTAAAGAQASLQSSLDHLGLANLDLGAMGGMQMFWIAAGALIALAAAGAMKLSQEI